MIKQAFVFFASSTDGQEACNQATTKANRFIQNNTLAAENVQIIPLLTSPFSGELNEGTTYCAITVIVTANNPITPVPDDSANSETLPTVEPVDDAPTGSDDFAF